MTRCLKKNEGISRYFRYHQRHFAQNANNVSKQKTDWKYFVFLAQRFFIARKRGITRSRDRRMSRLALLIPSSLSLRSMDAFFEPLFARSVRRAGFHEIITERERRLRGAAPPNKWMQQRAQGRPCEYADALMARRNDSYFFMRPLGRVAFGGRGERVATL